ncbi:MAG: M23 family metallopeptidase [Balneolaceae bacterium]|nr:M23 family metallopeptidase [Balneolaceae bacterium]
MQFFRLVLPLLLAFIVCDLPDERYQQFSFTKEITTTNDSHFVYLANPSMAPVRVRSNSKSIEPPIEFQFILPALSDTTFSFPAAIFDSSAIQNLSIAVSLGDPFNSTPDSSFSYSWPFPKGKSYAIMQAYFGKYSHSSDYSRFAIDFRMAEGDTIIAARDGIVIGVIEDYNVGGNNKKYRDFANYITLLHDDGTLSQYAHLMHKGALVEVGDTVKTLQPIGLAGNTGFSSAPHLHFNTIRAVDWTKTAGFPVQFEQMDGSEIKKGMTVSH